MFFLGFPDTQDRMEAALDCCSHLFSNRSVRFLVVLPALAVAAKDVLAACALQHCHAHVPRESAMRLRPPALSTNDQLRIHKPADIEKARKNDDVGSDIGFVGRISGIPSLGRGIHLPICSNKLPTHRSEV